MHKFGIVCGIFIINTTFFSCVNNENRISIEASTSYCYGSCPVLDFKLSQDVVYFNLIDFTELKGLYKYELNKGQLKIVDSLLNTIKIEKLKTEYVAELQDGQIINTKILRGDKKIKSVYYYNGFAPKNYESLIDYLIKLKDSRLVKLDSSIKFETRELIKQKKMPIPPLPK